MSTYWTIPRETTEWIGPVTGRTGVTDVEFALIPRGARPVEADWTAATIDDGAPGHLASDLEVGELHLWMRYVDGPELVVHESVGVITVT